MVDQIRMRQRTATLGLAALTIVGTLLLIWRLGVNQDAAHRVNESGLQRALSQRIAWFGTRVANLPEPSCSVARDELDNAISTMRDNAARLHESAAPSVRSLYDTPPQAVLDRTTAFLSLAMELSEASRTQDGAVLAERSEGLAVQAETLLPALHQVVQAEARHAEVLLDRARWLTVGMCATLLAALYSIWTLVFRPTSDALEQERQTLTELNEARDAQSSEQRFASALRRALEMADGEDALLATAQRSLEHIQPPLPVEILLADSSQAHLKQSVVHPSLGGPGCQVASPHACPAVRHGRTILYSSSRALDACPHLVADKAGHPCGAACVPVAFMGKPIGVMHATFEEDEAPPQSAIHRMEQVAAATASRLSTIRTFHQIQLQATTDPLTGLMNRRALAEKVRRLANEERSFAVAIGDLDHFKRLNDTHGHDAGDRALGTFSKAARDCVRDGDLVARFGGEEFVFVFPDTTASDAAQILEGLRVQLARVVAGNDTPTFTASYGVSDSRLGHNLDLLIQVADAALLRAKEEGRDRVLVADMGTDAPLREIDAA